jgi:hypothetical protein
MQPPMEPETGWRRFDTFVVKVLRGTGDALSGIVQHVRTGEKLRFEGFEDLRQALIELSRRPLRRPRPDVSARIQLRHASGLPAPGSDGDAGP